MYLFPRSKFASENTLPEQIRHIASESEEIFEEMVLTPPNHDRLAEEIVDLIHSCETGLHICHEQHGIDGVVLAKSVQEPERLPTIGEETDRIYSEIDRLLYSKIHPAMKALITAQYIIYIIKCCESAMDRLRDGHGIKLADVVKAVITKNSARWYYQP